MDLIFRLEYGSFNFLVCWIRLLLESIDVLNVIVRGLCGFLYFGVL